MAEWFAEKVRQLRRSAGMTQEALAERSGVSVSTIRGIETGKRANPQLASVRLLAQALGLQPGEQDELLTLAGGTPPNAQVPRQLPAPPPGFTGRSAELASLSASTGPVVVSALGGTGKTALVLRWGNDHTDRFPDGQLYVNLRGFGPTAHPMDPADAQRGFLTALGVESIPIHEDERTALYRSTTAGKRLLVVLDNAADTQQVEPLMPGGTTCAVMVTSRRRLTGLVALHGAISIPLGVLSEENSGALLATRIGATRVADDPGAVDAMVRYCSGLPLALVIIAARASVRPDVPLRQIADELAAVRLDALDTEEGMSLRSVLWWSFQSLTAEAKILATLLAIAPGADIGVAAVDSLSPWPARRLLGELEAASLVIRSGDRYRMHDLVRLYASEQEIPDETRTVALRRVIDFYLHTSLPAETSLAPQIAPIELGPPAPGCHPLVEVDAHRWFDAEHDCLVEAQRLALELGWYTLTWQLAWVMNTYHYRMDRMDSQRQTWLRAITAIRALDDPFQLGRAHRLVADAAARSHLRDEAVEHLQQALAIVERGTDLNEVAHTHRSFTVLYDEFNEHEHALAHASTALELYTRTGLTFRMAEAYNAVGWHTAKVGRFAEALEPCEYALRLSREHGYEIVEASTLNDLGYIYQHTARLPEAVAHYRDGAALWGKLGYGHNEAVVLRWLGAAHLDLGEPGEAEVVWRRAAKLLRESHRHAEADALERRLAEIG